MNDLLKELIEEPLVYYIYQEDYSIYDISTSIQKFIAVIDKNYIIPDKYKGSVFSFYTMDEWFKMVLDNDILAWQCSCLNRKYIYKEYVKLTITPDNLKLRKNFDAMFDPSFLYAEHKLSEGNFSEAKKAFINILKVAEFSNQIFDNHKIINYKAVKQFYNDLNSVGEDYDKILEKFLDICEYTVIKFRNNTEGILQNYKIKKVKND